QIFRYAPLSDRLNIICKTLGQHEIATVQSTSVDETAGLISLKTVLVHSSGEWISSNWPVALWKTWRARNAWGRRSPMRGATLYLRSAAWLVRMMSTLPPSTSPSLSILKTLALLLTIARDRMAAMDSSAKNRPQNPGLNQAQLLPIRAPKKTFS